MNICAVSSKIVIAPVLLVVLVLGILVVVAVVGALIAAGRKKAPNPVPSTAPQTPSVDNSAERAKILGMLEEGKIDADEAERLIEALTAPEGE